MLKLSNPIKYTEEENTFIANVLKQLQGEGWDDQKNKTKAIKSRINQHTLTEQKHRCAYCESFLLEGADPIDHIAPKSLYGEFTFEPYNLVKACTSCNNKPHKGETDTIKHPEDRNEYSNNTFSIVHPYFDDPDDHLKYADDDKIIFDKNKCSEEGLATIKMFHWEEPWAIAQRLINAKTRDLLPEELENIANIITYKERNT